MTDELPPAAPEPPAPPDSPELADPSGATRDSTMDADVGAETRQPLPASPPLPDSGAHDGMATPPTDRYPGARPATAWILLALR